MGLVVMLTCKIAETFSSLSAIPQKLKIQSLFILDWKT